MFTFRYRTNTANGSVIVAKHTLFQMASDSENGQMALHILKNVTIPSNVTDDKDGYTTFRCNMSLDQVEGLLSEFGGIKELSQAVVPADAVIRSAWNNKMNNRRADMKRKAQRY